MADQSSSETVLDPSTRIPMTDLQEQMIAESRRNPASNHLILTMRYTGSAPPTVDALREAWMKVLSRHSIFQTCFNLGDMTQQSSDYLNWQWSELEVPRSIYDKTIQIHEQGALGDLESSKPADLELPSCAMSCISTPRREGGTITIVWRVHHTLIDESSVALLLADVEKVLAGEKPSPSPRYQDYSRYLHTYKERNIGKMQEIWGPMLKDLQSNKPLRVVPPISNPAPTAVLREFTAPTGCNIRDLHAAAQRYGIARPTLVYAAWALTLRTLTSSVGVSMTLSMSGRLPWGPAASLVGPTTSRTPLTTHVPDDIQLAEWLLILHGQIEAVSELQSCTPLPTSILSAGDYYTHHNTLVQCSLGLPNTIIPNWQLRQKQSPSFDLVWNVSQLGDEVRGTIQFAPRACDAAWAGRVGQLAANAFRTLIAARPEAEIAQVLASIA